MNQALLKVSDLKVEFPTRRGNLVAVDRISFSIMPGEVLGVVGESGAGKSLTGAAIIGLLEPPGRIAGGEIILDNIINTNPIDFVKKLLPVYKGIEKVKSKLKGKNLIGFVGAPWTLLLYMLNQESPKNNFNFE